jgi:hypothetical protein
MVPNNKAVGLGRRNCMDNENKKTNDKNLQGKDAASNGNGKQTEAPTPVKVTNKERVDVKKMLL